MYEQLKVFGLKALQEGLLENIGRINIICGKNNSGKSTVLEAINNPKLRLVGFKFSERNLNWFFEEASMHLRFVGETDGNAKPRHRQFEDDSIKPLFLKALKAAIPESQVWFEQDISQFHRTINSALRDANLIGHRYKSHENNRYRITYIDDGGHIQRAYGQLFKRSETNSVLVPPKRNLELTKEVNPKAVNLPTGEGVLNSLFFAKNQLPNSSAKRFYDLISEAFVFVSSGHHFQIEINPDNQLGLYFSYGSQRWIEAKSCGVGLQEILVLLYYANHPDYQVVLIEEPENHLHPEMQNKLLHYLATQTNKQFFLATHSNIFLSSQYIDRVFFTTLEGQVIKINDATSRALILQSLGYSVTDNLVSDLVILVEGPSDKPFLEEFLRKMDLIGKYEIKIWPLGGDIMADLDLSVFAQNYKILALIDNDPGSSSIRKKFAENCEIYSIPVHRLERYAIENYYSLPALRKVFGKQIHEDVVDIKPHEKLENQIGLNTKKRSRYIAREMDLSDIHGTDLYDFLEQVRTTLIGPNEN